jgi:hypothetical protein
MPIGDVKIDIEGFELEALKGADRLLSSIRPKLLMEIHPGQLTQQHLFNSLGTAAFPAHSHRGP